MSGPKRLAALGSTVSDDGADHCPTRLSEASPSLHATLSGFVCPDAGAQPALIANPGRAHSHIHCADQQFTSQDRIKTFDIEAASKPQGRNTAGDKSKAATKADKCDSLRATGKSSRLADKLLTAVTASGWGSCITLDR